MSRLGLLALAAAIISACWFFRGWLERDPLTHVLLQLPLLALAGGMIAQALAQPKLRSKSSDRSSPAWMKGGLPLILVAIFTIAYWMLPRSIDAALLDPEMELLKFITVPCLIGAPLAIGWGRAHPLLRGFLKAQTISMLAVMAFLYTHAPIRICNVYLVADQERLGVGFLIAAVTCALLWSLPIFWKSDQTHPLGKRAITS